MNICILHHNREIRLTTNGTSTVIQTVITKAFSGKLARGINNRFIEEMSQYEGDIPDYPIQNELTSSIRKAAANIGQTKS